LIWTTSPRQRIQALATYRTARSLPTPAGTAMDQKIENCF
jgi:hypothetical protein